MSSVVMNNYEKKAFAFVKGSPERIKELCNQDLLPVDFERELEVYTS